ncbi:MAG: ankyrin repeat domain-containing protein, partial [Spirochaetota bacterium]
MRRTVLGAGLILAAAFAVLTGCASSEARAARSGDIDALREYVADGGDVNASQRNGRTLLMISTEAGQVESVRYLLDNGALVDARD